MRMKAEKTKYRGNSGSSFIPSTYSGQALHPSSLCSSAFTLIELLVVIGIIAILVAILLPTVAGIRKKAYSANTQANINQLAAAIEAYNNDFHAYPGPFSNSQVCNATPTGIIGGSYANASSTTIPLPTTNPPTGYDVTPVAFKNLTMSENLVLGIMGGLTVDSSNNLVYDPRLVGNGPNTLLTVGLNKHTNPYISDSKYLSWSMVGGLKTGHFSDDSGQAADTIIPAPIDAFPDAMPLLYLRAKKGASVTLNATNTNYGPTYNTVITYDSAEPADPNFRIGQYDLHQIIGYTKYSPRNGLVTVNPAATTPSSGTFDAYPYFRNQSLSSPNEKDTTSTYSNLSSPRNDVPKQKDMFIIISAGPDRIFGTSDDITNFGPVGQ